MDVKSFEIILASGSPRRSELLKSMDIPFRVELKSIDETYPKSMNPEQVPVFLAEAKANAYSLPNDLQVLITADTLVLLENEVLGKPEDEIKAEEMLRKLSGKTHTVITAVCLRDKHRLFSFSDTTLVRFTHLSNEEIQYYIKTYKPLDKAGAYGIQDWIGMVAIESIQGSYTNVMGLPTEKLYRHLIEFLTSMKSHGDQ